MSRTDGSHRRNRVRPLVIFLGVLLVASSTLAAPAQADTATGTESDPCPWNEDLDADDPACVEPPCEHDAEIAASHPDCVPPGGGGGQTTTTTTDVCSNLVGDQASVPAGSTLDGDDCELPVDVCDNVDGEQAEVPDGMVIGESGGCEAVDALVVVDRCPNLDGDQAEVPPGLATNAQGDCLEGEVLPAVLERPAGGVAAGELPRTGAGSTAIAAVGLLLVATGTAMTVASRRRAVATVD